jgi:CheY-like chemotaxis protein
MGARTTILYVEDEPDMRDLITEVLSQEGYEVQPAATAELALAQLESRSFDLLLTDYRLPKQSGVWLLRQATRRGFLERTPVIVMSAEEDPPGIRGVPFLQKPVEFDVLFSAVRAATSAAPQPEVAPGAQADLLLVLYVSPGSPESQRATRRLREMLAGLQPGRVDLAVVDTRSEGAADRLEEDRIVATPTLVKKGPGPKMWFVGNLSNTGMVEEMIRAALVGRDEQRLHPKDR